MSARQSAVEVVGLGTSVSSTDSSAGNKKSSSHGGGRTRGGSRVSSKGHQGHGPSEELMPASGPPPRRKAPSSHKDTKSRPSTQRPHSYKEGFKAGVGGGGGGSQHSSRGKGAEFGYGHRHHPASGSADGSAGGRAEARILSSNRFEKLEIDPEHEASGGSLGSSTSGENLSKSSSSTSLSSYSNSTSKGGEEKRAAKERSSSSSRSGRGGFRGRGGAKPQAQESGEPSDGTRAVGGTQKEERNLKETPDGGPKKRSPKLIKFDLPPDVECVKEKDVEHGRGLLEQTAGVHGTSSLSKGGDAGATPSEAGSTEAVGTEATSTRIVYNRDTLLALRKLSDSLSPPPELATIDLLHYLLPGADKNNGTEDSRPKHPTALTLIKEHDKNLVSKVSLSPQRGSFQRGCSWKDRLSNSDISQNSSESSLKTPPPKFSCSEDSGLRLEGQKPQGGVRLSAPRVIHHVPLRDQGLAGHEAGRKGWKGRDGRQGYAEPEPEWMEFGPMDRFDVIELKGFDKHEVGREDGGKDVTAAKSSPAEELPASDGPDSPKENRRQAGDPEPQAPTPSPQEDNEFILDGFDFSTGVSICQALDLDDDEASAATAEGLSVLPPRPGAAEPSELSSVLLKALGMTQGSEQRHQSPPVLTNTGISNKVISGAPPANALTLEQIHAREDIYPSQYQPPTSTSSVGEGMEAFNKLLAALESKQNKTSQQQEDYPPSSSVPQNVAAGPPGPQRVRAARPENPAKQVSPSFGYPLDKELLNIEEDLSGANMPFPEPNLRRLEQLERMLETMDRMDPTTAQLYDYHNTNTTAQPAPHTSFPPHPHRHHHQVDQRTLPVHPAGGAHLDREGRGWMYAAQEQPRARTHPTPQQFAAARQHQMLTSSRGCANNWAVEMEQRRVMELRQMQLAKEKELYGGAAGHSGSHHQGYKPPPSSKPNISLLPTAVMRHMHSSKPGQTGNTDLPKTISISNNRLDQDMPSKAHSVLNSLLTPNQDFSGPNDYALHGHHRVMQPTSRMAPPSGHNPSDLPPAGSVYPHYNLPHGMPVHNPYNVMY